MKIFGSFRLDAVNHCLWRGEERLSLAPKAFDVQKTGYLLLGPLAPTNTGRSGSKKVVGFGELSWVISCESDLRRLAPRLCPAGTAREYHAYAAR